MALEARTPRRHDAPETPARARLLAWLTDPRVVADGAVMSWYDPVHPGYPYPEAAALWLSWSAWRLSRGEPAPPAAQIQQVAAALTGALDRDGAIGRDGTRYLFDTCLALHALTRIRAAVPALTAPDPNTAARGLRRFLDAGPALPPSPPRRWSDRWSPHHLRGAALLALAGRRAGAPDLEAIAMQIRDRVDAPLPEPAYTHALAYGAEGALLFRALGTPGTAARAVAPERAAKRLVAAQRPDGALPAFLDGSGGPRADSTAQAIRIWAAVAPSAYGQAIERARANLLARQTDEGALPYGEGTGDLNTWATIFADQALAWASEGVEPAGWI